MYLIHKGCICSISTSFCTNRGFAAIWVKKLVKSWGRVIRLPLQKECLNQENLICCHQYCICVVDCDLKPPKQHYQYHGININLYLFSFITWFIFNVWMFCFILCMGVKDVKICHPKIYHFGNRIIWSWKHLKRSRYKKSALTFTFLSEDRR